MKRIITSVTSVLCLTLLSLPAQAHVLTAAIATPECDRQEIDLNFKGKSMDPGPYLIDYTITLTPTDGGAVISINHEFNSTYPNGPNYTFDEKTAESIPTALEGRNFSVSGFATLYQPAGTPYNTFYLNGGDVDRSEAPDPLLVSCAPQLGSIGNRVWLDSDADGLQEDCDANGDNCSDVGVDGVVATLGELVGTIENGFCGFASDARTDVTADGGFYLFDNLEAGTYCVQFKDPDGRSCTLVDQGTNDFVDSDADFVLTGSNGQTFCKTDFVTIGPGEDNLSVDLGLIPLPTASLGDRVWEDLNGNGIQDDGEPGVPGATVSLFMTDSIGDCSIPMEVPSETTDANGIYGFDGLVRGDYCVQFDISSLTGFCEPGDPVFTTYTAGNDIDDSDAHPDNNGKSDGVTLAAGDENTSLDAGIYCPVSLGDRVWIDVDRNGQQDCTDTSGDTILGNAGDEGVDCPAEVPDDVKNVTVFLTTPGDDGQCGTDDDDPSSSTSTNLSGFYSFGGLVPGNYCVAWVPPAGYDCTAANVGDDESDDVSDSDGVDIAGGLCGVSGDPISLNSGDEDITVDLGLSRPPLECGLSLDKSCRVEAPPTQDFDKCDGKLKQFTLLATTTISNIQLAEDPDNPNRFNATSVAAGEELTVFGPFSDNDVEITFTGGEFGQSVFHMSCSDEDFNDPLDCGKEAGDGKSNDSAFDNVWLLEGFIDDSDRELDCNSNNDDGFEASCTFEKPPAPSCDTTGDPDELTWRFDGGLCSDSSFADLQKDFECTSDGSLTFPITVVDDKGDSYLVDELGDEFTMLRDGAKEITLISAGVVTQTIVLHTSCSQPIVVGETAGALTLVAMDGLTGGTDVTYRYVVSNSGDPLTGVVVSDDPLGDIGGPVDLGTGESKTFYSDPPVTLFETTVNTGSAQGMLADGDMCGPEGVASDTVTVTVVEPACAIGVKLDKVEDDKLKIKLTNNDSRDRTVTMESLMVSYPAARGVIEKVKLDGDAYKFGDSENPITDNNPASFGPDDWTEDDVTKRQIKAGDTKTLEIETFDKSSKDGLFELTVDFGDGEGCTLDIEVENQIIN